MGARAQARAQPICFARWFIAARASFWSVYDHFCLLIDYFGGWPIEPLWKIAVKFGFYILGFGLFMGSTIWNDNERDFKKDTNDDDVA